MTYDSVAIYTLEGDFVGYGIKGEHKLQSTNIYAENETMELSKQIERLNSAVDIRKYWPHPQDPEVVALLDDENFCPVAMIDTEVVDEDNSQLVYKQIARPALEAEHLGQGWVDSDEVDEEASTLAYKTIKAPAKPTDIMWRIKQASEQVARQRAGLV